MSEPVKTGTSPEGSPSDALTLVNLERSPDLRFVPLFLLVFVINVAVVILAWLLIDSVI